MNSDDVVLITGGSRGIGRAIALRLARDKPAHIVIAYSRNHAAARETVADIEALGVSASAIVTDVSQSDLLQRTFDDIRAQFGRLDVFVSNAARATFRPILDITPSSWQRMMDLNATAFLQGAQFAAGIMRDAGRGGTIIGLSSLGSTYALPGYAGLGAAKAAIESLTRYLSAELAPLAINVNTVSGGFIDTESMRSNPDYGRVTAYVKSRTPAGRLGEPEDLAGIVAFLCTPDARWICGQTIIADGGMSLLA